MRFDGRKQDQLREVTMTCGYIETAYRSVLVSFGNTRVICTATVEDKVPHWLKGSGQGWVSAEYSMLPAATEQRNQREVNKGKQSGRTQEIQRLIGRSLRAVTDLTKIPNVTIWFDCDVIEADGGTRTAAITGAFLALKMTAEGLLKEGRISEDPIKEHLAAVSTGVLHGKALLDLAYLEDVAVDVDMNLVMTESGRFVEIQGTGEESTFSKEELSTMIDLGSQGIKELIEKQKAAMKKILIASRNKGKIAELEKILMPLGFSVSSLLDYPEMADIPETGATFKENALIKARFAAETTGIPALADDSGLEVDILDGRPGIYSARFAGDHADDQQNNRKLLEELSGVSPKERTARYVCALTIYDPEKGILAETEGTCEGQILENERGTGGFGYDPLFYLPDFDQTFAEIPLDIKNRISHRGRALQRLKETLKNL